MKVSELIDKLSKISKYSKIDPEVVLPQSGFDKQGLEHVWDAKISEVEFSYNGDAEREEDIVKVLIW